MQFYRCSSAPPRTLGILAGSFNPPTRAHLELAWAARSRVDEILCIVPQKLPHKEYFGATLEQRIEMLASIGLPENHAIASTDRGLFIDIARECRSYFGPEPRMYFICGRDTAERILIWDYGRAGVVEAMLQDFELLVAPRLGQFAAPGEFVSRIHALSVSGEYDEASSTEVRERIAKGQPWEHLVPEKIVEVVRSIYS